MWICELLSYINCELQVRSCSYVVLSLTWINSYEQTVALHIELHSMHLCQMHFCLSPSTQTLKHVELLAGKTMHSLQHTATNYTPLQRTDDSPYTRAEPTFYQVCKCLLCSGMRWENWCSVLQCVAVCCKECLLEWCARMRFSLFCTHRNGHCKIVKDTARNQNTLTTLLHTATHCNTLQYPATPCNTLQQNAGNRKSELNTMPYTATH